MKETAGCIICVRRVYTNSCNVVAMKHQQQYHIIPRGYETICHVPETYRRRIRYENNYCCCPLYPVELALLLW